MIPGETIHLGDGAYLYFDGYGVEFLANDHLNPTDQVYVEDVGLLLRTLQEIYDAR